MDANKKLLRLHKPKSQVRGHILNIWPVLTSTHFLTGYKFNDSIKQEWRGKRVVITFYRFYISSVVVVMTTELREMNSIRCN